MRNSNRVQYKKCLHFESKGKIVKCEKFFHFEQILKKINVYKDLDKNYFRKKFADVKKYHQTIDFFSYLKQIVGIVLETSLVMIFYAYF